MSDEKLGDRIVDFIRNETGQYHAKLADKELNGETYSMAFEVNHIAEKLGVVPEAVNGALGHLHRAKRVIGFRVIMTGRNPTYAIALSPEP